MIIGRGNKCLAAPLVALCVVPHGRAIPPKMKDHAQEGKVFHFATIRNLCRASGAAAPQTAREHELGGSSVLPCQCSQRVIRLQDNAMPQQEHDPRPGQLSVPPCRWLHHVGRLWGMAVNPKNKSSQAGGKKCPAVPMVGAFGAPAGDGCPPQGAEAWAGGRNVPLCQRLHLARSVQGWLSPNKRGTMGPREEVSRHAGDGTWWSACWE